MQLQATITDIEIVKIPSITAKISLRNQIFVAMIFLVLLACLLILIATYFQYQNESEDYNLFRLNRKEIQLRNQISYLVNTNNLENKSDDHWIKYKDDFTAIMKIHNVNFSVFNLKGDALFNSFLPLEIIANNYKLSESILTEINSSIEKRVLIENNNEVGKFQSSYSLLFNSYGVPYGVLFFPYFEDVSFSENELNKFLNSLYKIYLAMLIVAILFAYFISKYVTRPLETIRLKIDQTGLLEQNEKIHLKNATKEVFSLINSYNQMIDELEKSAKKLAIQEREQAWQEMAKQVAHEIKNPLTPMRLTVQSFEQRFLKNKPYSKEKIKEFSKILIEQIDTMKDVANAFSDFAALPEAKLKSLDIVEISRRSLEIFEQIKIVFTSSHPKIFVNLDRTQWVRVMTNLIQNGIQSVPAESKVELKVEIKKLMKEVQIHFSDNGIGISKSIKDKIFEPKFTTKTKGMGLGLGIVKNIVSSHGGKINYSSSSKGTKFTITLKI